ncbi:Ger(x)C family spore germination protein [Virgibacillus proomii]|uniref:Ger(x)C family spore germination protein n=1 Tax=Virgibacillus proomii TaxID=84407 RepID=UPI001C116F95|nr:Ger(x)C family spore germination protein [Virgibacillus proomii]MBU5267258.1 Ger(x)C family spore germination protein [Virgibacillus proomii]
MRNNFKKVFICIFFLLFLTACWDRVEIEERGFVVGSAVDLVDKKADGTYELEVTNQFVIPSGLENPSQGGQGEPTAYKNVTVRGESIFEIIREMAILSSEIPFFQHMKVVIVSEEIVREPGLFSKIIDVYIRDHEMRRGMKVAIVKNDKAKDVLEVMPVDEKVPAFFIDSLMESNYKNASSLKHIPVGQLQELMLNDRSYTVPEVEIISPTKLKYKNAAVIHAPDDKMVASLSDDETAGLNFLIEPQQMAPVNVNLEGHTVVVELFDGNPDIKVLKADKNNIEVEISISLEGNIAEEHGFSGVLTTSFFKKLEKATEERVKELTEKTIEVAQNDLKVDFIGIGDVLFERHYKVWKEIKDNWDVGTNYFSKSKINVKVDATISKAGASDSMR